MNNCCKFIALAVLSLCCAAGNDVNAQAFRKGSLLISLSEGTTYSTYTTTNFSGNADVVNSGNNTGNHDPLTIEYGITNHWGIGINMGGDLYNVDPSKYYNFQTSTNNVKAVMSELTLDANYHFFITRHVDLAAFVSLGFSSVSFSGNNNGDNAYQYKSGGMIVRSGTKAKYYFTKRFGAMGMVSIFATQNASDGIKGNTVGNNYTTTIKGTAIEFGLCYRILR